MEASVQTGTPDTKTEVAAESFDIRLITFTLGKNEYAINIMNVKEIANANRFTHVPNVSHYVRGVYNLRGEIISIIDLRIFFNTGSKIEEGAMENLLILKVDGHIFGIIVDAIDKVIPTSSASITPPHPIFSNINVRYIEGVVEHSEKIYIILDPASLVNIGAMPQPYQNEFSSAVQTIEQSTQHHAEQQVAQQTNHLPQAPVQVTQTPIAPQVSNLNTAGMEVEAELTRLNLFYRSPVNEKWLIKNIPEWQTARKEKGKSYKIENVGDAQELLAKFWSAHTGQLWSSEKMKDFMASLPELNAKNINVWNLGCGKGFETYSLACAFKKKYPNTRVKIWANDSDLLSISSAPTLTFKTDFPDFFVEYLLNGRSGFSFVQSIKDSILFEFHDVFNPSNLPPIDFIVARDIISVVEAPKQKILIDKFASALKAEGLLFIGDNEELSTGWKAAGTDASPAYQKA